MYLQYDAISVDAQQLLLCQLIVNRRCTLGQRIKKMVIEQDVAMYLSENIFNIHSMQAEHLVLISTNNSSGRLHRPADKQTSTPTDIEGEIDL